MKSLIAFLFSVLVLGSAVAAENPTSVPQLFGTPENLRLVRDADSVDACILRHIEPATRADGSIDRSTERYEETAFFPLPPNTSSALPYLLLDERTYDWKSAGGRRPQFYARLRFHRGKDVLAIDFCFLCQVLSLSRGDTELGHANFSGNADLLLLAFRNIFPDDEPLKLLAKEAGLPH